jgi:hypothetical protein
MGIEKLSSSDPDKLFRKKIGLVVYYPHRGMRTPAGLRNLGKYSLPQLLPERVGQLFSVVIFFAVSFMQISFVCQVWFFLYDFRRRAVFDWTPPTAGDEDDGTPGSQNSEQLERDKSTPAIQQFIFPRRIPSASRRRRRILNPSKTTTNKILSSRREAVCCGRKWIQTI